MGATRESSWSFDILAPGVDGPVGCCVCDWVCCWAGWVCCCCIAHRSVLPGNISTAQSVAVILWTMQAEILERVCPGFIAVLADFFIYRVACRSPRPTDQGPTETAASDRSIQVHRQINCFRERDDPQLVELTAFSNQLCSNPSRATQRRTAIKAKFQSQFSWYTGVSSSSMKSLFSTAPSFGCS